jgi:hypothetical protein
LSSCLSFLSRPARSCLAGHRCEELKGRRRSTLLRVHGRPTKAFHPLRFAKGAYASLTFAALGPLSPGSAS